MRYKVVLSKNEDGYTVNCPGLRGCWSQGAGILKDAGLSAEDFRRLC